MEKWNWIEWFSLENTDICFAFDVSISRIQVYYVRYVHKEKKLSHLNEIIPAIKTRYIYNYKVVMIAICVILYAGVI